MSNLFPVPPEKRVQAIKKFYELHPEYKNIKKGDQIWWMVAEVEVIPAERHIPWNEIPFTVEWVNHDEGELCLEYGSCRYSWEADVFEMFIEEPFDDDIIKRRLELMSL